MKRKEFEMSDSQLEKLLAACAPQPAGSNLKKFTAIEVALDV